MDRVIPSADRSGSARARGGGSTVLRAVGIEARTVLTGVDPRLQRLRSAGVAVASTALAGGAMAVVVGLSGGPVTAVVIAAVLAMLADSPPTNRPCGGCGPPPRSWCSRCSPPSFWALC